MWRQLFYAGSCIAIPPCKCRTNLTNFYFMQVQATCIDLHNIITWESGCVIRTETRLPSLGACAVGRHLLKSRANEIFLGNSLAPNDIMLGKAISLQPEPSIRMSLGPLWQIARLVAIGGHFDHVTPWAPPLTLADGLASVTFVSLMDVI